LYSTFENLDKIKFILNKIWCAQSWIVPNVVVVNYTFEVGWIEKLSIKRKLSIYTCDSSAKSWTWFGINGRKAIICGTYFFT